MSGQVKEEALETHKDVLSAAKVVLEKDVRLKIAVIGVGNAGNQAIIKVHKENIPVYAVNTSIKDLSDTILDDTIPSFIIGHESRGAGKDRNKANALWKENGRELFQEPIFMKMMQHSDIIFVSFATGGGTGSEIGPEISSVLVRMFPKKIIIPYGIAPKNSDSITAKNNNIQAIDEIKSLNVPYLIDDLSFFEDKPNDVAFDEIGKHVVETIKVIAMKYLTISGSQMIDENDMKIISSEPGYMGVYFVDKLTNANLESKTLQAIMIDKIKKSPTMAIQKDGIYKQMGAIINCPSDMMEVTKTGNYSELYQFLGGTSKGCFENYSVTSGTSGQFIIILSGMTLPINRINCYIEAIKEHEENLKRVKEINLSQDVDRYAFLSGNNSEKLSSDTTATNAEVNNVLNDIFN